MTKKPVNLTHYSSEEMLAAAGQFDFLYDKNIEEPSDYLERKRNRDMQKIISIAVQNELDEIKRAVFMKIFFFGEKVSDVAEETGLSQSAVYKQYERALKIVRKALKYVRLYQCACKSDGMMPLECMRRGAYIPLGYASAPAIVMRISRLMEKENIREDMLCDAIGMNKAHFEKIFSGKAQPDAEEIVKLSGFFGVSTDYILKGDLS